MARRAVQSGTSNGLTGRVQRFGDHIDTDAIIPGEFCHLTAFSDLGEKCFFHVRPGFAAHVREGYGVIVAGEGWGSGSSREQAVWALKGAGVQVVIARSYAFIHKRNLVNEALPYLVMKDEGFYERAVDGAEVSVDLAAGVVTVAGEAFHAETPTRIVQALATAGGIVPAIQAHGNDVFERLTH
jgi:3-isopropylmalate dehydratase small subunit